MLKLQDINVTLGKGTPLERKILDNLNINIKQQEFMVIMGDNGAGKSTLFNIISGLIRPDSGKIIINKQDVTNMSRNKRAFMVSKVMQDPKVGTMENMTIFENMAFAIKRGQTRGLKLFLNNSKKLFFQKKLMLLDMGLEDRLNELVSNLSGGQRQALSLIMAVLTGSKILLLDEITAALDPKSSENIMQLVVKIVKEEKLTCIMITHNMADAVKYGNSLVVLKNGGLT
jgi:putative tryptophan/tyrosine transport system ATP-binding protein